jgi:hypothetical protein
VQFINDNTTYNLSIHDFLYKNSHQKTPRDCSRGVGLILLPSRIATLSS